MRLRTVLLALVSALTLTLSVSTAAYANAKGTFTYEYRKGGIGKAGMMSQPELNTCKDAVVDDDEGVYSLDAVNDTDATVHLYALIDCEGGEVATLNPKQSDNQGQHFRSVRFTKAAS